MRITKTWTISLPTQLDKEAERTAREENRTKSELVREALRRYLDERRWQKLRKKAATQAQAIGIRSEEDVDRVIHEVRR